MQKVTSIEEYILKNEKWEDELIALHELFVSLGLQEGIKWGGPVYMLHGKNVVGVGAFKNHMAIWFFQGVFLSDRHNALVNAQEGTTKAMRQMRIEAGKEINAEIVRQYVLEAIENQKAGKEVKPGKNKVVIPEELQAAFDQDPAIEKAFNNFTPGKQFEFTHHISKAKREETRLRRCDKVIPLILNGIGFNDKYR